MSVRTMARVWDQSSHAGTELLMLLAIADFADDDGNAYPSIGTLATKCRMTARNVNHIMVALRASGELEVLENMGPHGTNRYRITLVTLKPASPLKGASPLKPASSTPEAGFLKPLKPASDEPSGNHQEPPKKKREQRSAPKHRIPDDWKPSDSLKAWAAQTRPDLELPLVVENFRDYWISHGTARADWNASFRAWVRKEHPATKGKGNGRSRHTGLDQIDYEEKADL